MRSVRSLPAPPPSPPRPLALPPSFVTLQFIPEGVDLKPILPVLAKVFDQALEGGGAKSINFQARGRPLPPSLSGRPLSFWRIAFLFAPQMPHVFELYANAWPATP